MRPSAPGSPHWCGAGGRRCGRWRRWRRWRPTRDWRPCRASRVRASGGGADRAWRQRTTAHGSLPRHALGSALQPDDSRLLSAIAGGGQAGESGTLRRRAQAAPSGMGAGDETTTVRSRSSRPSRAHCRLTTNTVSLGDMAVDGIASRRPRGAPRRRHTDRRTPRQCLTWQHSRGVGHPSLRPHQSPRPVASRSWRLSQKCRSGKALMLPSRSLPVPLAWPESLES
jgi:hypothetical protein